MKVIVAVSTLFPATAGKPANERNCLHTGLTSDTLQRIKKRPPNSLCETIWSLVLGDLMLIDCFCRLHLFFREYGVRTVADLTIFTNYSTTKPTAQLLTDIAAKLIGAHEPLSVEVSDVGDTSQFVVRVAREDLNKIMGPEGRTAESLRVIVRAAGMKYGRCFDLAIGTELSAKRSQLFRSTASLNTTQANRLRYPM